MTDVTAFVMLKISNCSDGNLARTAASGGVIIAACVSRMPGGQKVQYSNPGGPET